MIAPLQEDFFQTLFDNLAEPRIVIKANSPTFTVVACNKQYKIVSCTEDINIIGKSMREIHPPTDSESEAAHLVIQNALNMAIEKREVVRLPAIRYDLPSADLLETNQSWWQAEYVPISATTDSSVEYLMCTTHNITKQVLSQSAMQKAKLQLQHAVDSAAMGTWSVDPATYLLSFSNRSKELFGLPSEKLLVEEAMKAIDPEFHQLLRDIIHQGIEHYQDCDMDFPITNLVSGERKWIRITGKMFFEDNSIPAHFSGMLMDITERKLDDLRKNDFIAMVSHELKTPLTSLKAYTQILTLRAKKAEDSFTTVALEKINAQVRKMITLINSFLNISRLESGKIHLEKTDFNLTELINETVKEVAWTTRNYDIFLRPSQPLEVNADREKIGQVINNLLSNAAKYSPLGKQIEISCNHINGMAQISVKDQGIGIEAADTGKVFERFYRVENKRAQTVSGFGIGLYLCVEIIQRHNGKIGVKSEIGKGSTFWFTLPLT